MADIVPYLNSIFASAVCTAMVMYAFTRRKDGTRRMIFAAGAAIVVPVIVFAVMANQEFYHTDFTPTLLIVSVVAWLAMMGITLIPGMGWFGSAKHVGDHPYCRKCGFDLVGKPESSTRCSECGADLDAKKAIVIGVRTRRYWLIATSLFLFFLGLLVGGRPAYQAVAEVKWIEYEPMGWLLRDAHGPNGKTITMELIRRFQKENLSSRQISAFVQTVAAWPINANNASYMSLPAQWMTDHDDIDEADGRLVIQRAAQLAGLYPAPKTCRDMAIPIRYFIFTDGFWATGNFSNSTADVHVQMNGLDLPPLSEPDDSSIHRSDAGVLWAKIPDGNATITVNVHMVVKFRSHGKTLTEPVTQTLSGTTMIATGKAAEAPTTKPAAADLSSNWSAEFGISQGKFDESNGLRINRAAGSTRVFARVFLIDSNGRQDIGVVDVAQGAYFKAGPGFRRPAQSPHLELVPAPEETRDSWDQSPILDQKIRIDNVTVQDDTPPSN